MSPITRSSGVGHFGIAAVIVQCLALSACSQQPMPRVPPAAAPSPAPVAQKPPPQDNLFKVSPAVQAKCNLPDTPTDSPQFDFDDSGLRPRGMGILDGIATCVREGSLKGEGVTITGIPIPVEVTPTTRTSACAEPIRRGTIS